MLFLSGCIHSRTISLLLLTMLFVTLFLPTHGSDLSNGPGVYFSDLVVSTGEALEDGAVVYVGDVTVKQGGIVAGDLTVHDGDIWIGGRIVGDVLALAGDVFLDDSAKIEGYIELRDGNIERRDGSVVNGGVILGGEKIQPQGILAGAGIPVRSEYLALAGGLLLVLAAVMGVWVYNSRARKSTSSIQHVRPDTNVKTHDQLHCPHCGTAVSTNTTFCSGCGQRIPVVN